MSNTFLYFAYGSNMFSLRMNMNDIKANFFSIGRLDVSLN